MSMKYVVNYFNFLTIILPVQLLNFEHWVLGGQASGLARSLTHH